MENDHGSTINYLEVLLKLVLLFFTPPFSNFTLI